MQRKRHGPFCLVSRGHWPLSGRSPGRPAPGTRRGCRHASGPRRKPSRAAGASGYCWPGSRVRAAPPPAGRPANQRVAAVADPGSMGRFRSHASRVRRDTSAAAWVTSRTSTRRRRGISSWSGMRACSSCPMGPARWYRVRPRSLGRVEEPSVPRGHGGATLGPQGDEKRRATMNRHRAGRDGRVHPGRPAAARPAARQQVRAAGRAPVGRRLAVLDDRGPAVCGGYPDDRAGVCRGLDGPGGRRHRHAPPPPTPDRELRPVRAAPDQHRFPGQQGGADGSCVRGPAAQAIHRHAGRSCWMMPR
jgi:hypothetical protein